MKKLLLFLVMLLLTGCAGGRYYSHYPEITLSSVDDLESLIDIVLEDLGAPGDSLDEVTAQKLIGEGVTRLRFKHKGRSYEYDLEDTGRIRRCKKYGYVDANEKESKSLISEQEALELALNHAGLKEEFVRVKKVKLDKSYMHSEYEIEFVADMYEYEYEISVDGQIISFEKEHRFD